MKGRFTTKIARIQDFKQVKLGASRVPTAAIWISSILRSPRDLGIENPESRHISIEADFSSIGHGEFEEKDLFRAIESV